MNISISLFLFSSFSTINILTPIYVKKPMHLFSLFSFSFFKPNLILHLFPSLLYVIHVPQFTNSRKPSHPLCFLLFFKTKLSFPLIVSCKPKHTSHSSTFTFHTFNQEPEAPFPLLLFFFNNPSSSLLPFFSTHSKLSPSLLLIYWHVNYPSM